MKYLKAFPDYDDTLPTLAGFVDDSYKNDTCPSLYNEALNLKLWIDWKDETKREFPHCERYALADDSITGCGNILFTTDSLSEIEDYLKDINHENRN